MHSWHGMAWHCVRLGCSVLSGGDAAAGLVRAKAYRGLADFDDHLADIAADWSNAALTV
jgi:hypothetical protein